MDRMEIFVGTIYGVGLGCRFPVGFKHVARKCTVPGPAPWNSQNWLSHVSSIGPLK